MTPQETGIILERLTAAFPRLAEGNPKQRIAVWHEAFETFDFPTMMLAAREVIRHGLNTPTIAFVAEAYAAIRHRQQMEVPRIETGEWILSPVEGMRRAWEAYVKECGRRGREPNHSIFEKWIGGVAPTQPVFSGGTVRATPDGGEDNQGEA